MYEKGEIAVPTTKRCRVSNEFYHSVWSNYVDSKTASLPARMDARRPDVRGKSTDMHEMREKRAFLVGGRLTEDVP